MKGLRRDEVSRAVGIKNELIRLENQLGDTRVMYPALMTMISATRMYRAVVEQFINENAVRIKVK